MFGNVAVIELCTWSLALGRIVVKNIFEITHKYAPYTHYIQTALTQRELSYLTVALERLYFDALGGEMSDCIASPELSYFLTKYFGCKEVSRQQWLKACRRRQKTLDIYWNGQGHPMWRKPDVAATLVPAQAIVDLSQLSTIMQPWYVAYEAKVDEWVQQQHDADPLLEEAA